MKRIHFENFEDLVCNIADSFDSIKEFDEYNDVAIIAKYEEARYLIKELLCIGYNLHSIELHDETWENYNEEYIISVCNIDGVDEIFCEPMFKNNGYLEDESTIIYVLDNCSSKVVPYCKGKVMFEVSVGKEECCDCQCSCKEDDCTECTARSDDGYTITVKCNLDADEAMEMIKDMEKRMKHMNDMFREMDYFRRLLRF